MTDVTPLVPEARRIVLKAAEVYLGHTRPWFVGLTAQGSALKGGFIPGCSDIDLHLFLDDSAFQTEWELPLQLSTSIHRDLSRLDPTPFGYFQCHALPARLVGDHPIAKLGPVPGAYHLISGRLPVPEATAAEVRAESIRVLAGLDRLPFDIAGNLLEHGGGRLEATLRLLCTKVWPVVHSAAGYISNDPVGVWGLSKDEAVGLLSPDLPIGQDIRGFHRTVLAYYADRDRSVDGALRLIASGVKFLESARDLYFAETADRDS